MNRFLASISVVTAIVVLLALPACKDDNSTGPGTTLDSIGLVRFTMGGRTRAARVDSLSVAGNRMVAHGHWNEEVSVAGQPTTLLLECLLTSPSRPGMHEIDTTTDSTTFFTLIGAVIGNTAGSESFSAGKTNGIGSVTVSEFSDSLISGTFQMTLSNDADTTKKSDVTGEFGIARK